MRARLVFEKFQEDSDPIRDMNIGIHFLDSKEAGKYFASNIDKITGIDKDELSYIDPEFFSDSLIKKIDQWYKIYKTTIDNENYDLFWNTVIDELTN